MKAIVYSRVSTDAQERDGTSLDTQERACVEFAVERGWDIVRHVRDSASGSLLEREGLEVLRAAVRQAEADVVVAYAVDRLSRSQNHIGLLFDEFETAGVKLEFVTERFEDTAVGRFIIAARAFIAEVEREKIAERTMRGKEERAKSGRIPQATGRGIYGYKYDRETGRRVVNPIQASVVRRLFEDFAAGWSLLGVTNSLNEAGIPAYGGGTWSTWTVRNVLLNPAYCGHTFYRRTKTKYRRDPVTGRRRRVVLLRDRSDWIEVPGATPAIVPESLFETVQLRLHDPERRRVAKRKYRYQLSGHVRCALCDSAMVGQTASGGRYQYYRCRRSYSGRRDDRCPTRYVRVGMLEDAVVREVAAVLSSPEVVLAELRKAFTGGVDNRELADARELIASMEKQRKRLLRLYQMEEIDDSYLQRELAAIQARSSSAESTIARADRSPSRPRALEDPENFAAACAALKEQALSAADEGQLERIAKAMQLTVKVQRTDEELSGEMEGVIPIGYRNKGAKNIDFSPNMTHHCTNMGMTTCT